MPVAPAVAPDRVELIELAAIAVLVVSVAGPEAVVPVVFLTTVDAIPDPQVLFDDKSLLSPL